MPNQKNMWSVGNIGKKNVIGGEGEKQTGRVKILAWNWKSIGKKNSWVVGSSCENQTEKAIMDYHFKILESTW